MRFRRKAPAAGVLAVFILLSLSIFFVHRSKRQCALPVLMYHHFAETSGECTVVSTKRFREQMTALKNAGYQTVTICQILDYVDNGTPLPKKPVLITMDDGYTSNLTDAAPILEELGMCATVFVIGVNEGENLYVHSGEPLLPPRFSYEEAAPWVESGVLDLQSHTYDMHQLFSYGYSGRDGILPLEGETEDAWRGALQNDIRLFRQRREGRVATDLLAMAYPFGYYNQEADALLAEEGIRLTFTTEERANLLRIGQPDCLRLMGRLNVVEEYSGEALAGMLASYSRQN